MGLSYSYRRQRNMEDLVEVDVAMTRMVLDEKRKRKAPDTTPTGTTNSTVFSPNKA